MASIQVRGLVKHLGVRDVLKGVDFEAPSGDIVSLIGPSGCGKTTLLRCILGELEADGGEILLDGEDVAHTKVEKRRISIVYQDYALFPHLTVAENVGYGPRVRRWPAARREARVKELLELVRLEDLAGQHPRSLSGGQQQRVALARALAIEPRVLLLDEAFTALDSVTRSELMHQVREIIKRLQVTTILVTHDQEEAFLFAKHVVVLNEGRVVVSGRPAEVMKHKHPFLQDFVKMVMLHRGEVQRDATGRHFVQVEGGTRIPLALAGVHAGDEVHVMVKKGPDRERFEVWPVGKP